MTYFVHQINTVRRKVSSLSGTFAFDLFVLLLRNVAKISIEGHLVNSIVILELTLKGISATIANSKSF